METLKNSLTAIIQFFKKLNIKSKKNTENPDYFEIKHTPFGVNFKQDSTPKSLFHQMYAQENETLFI